ncbi:hypothetical protein EVAR_25544_1 [Eumeta japonica]|uniref:Uncharacterized protein n=1 Tax=Eumeta variegata TaxID=151549 RepID=A0A4C1Z2D4_EUMVA|nr:hypothetical protein EVAR_25544_1 [Eumeta japonica]
MSTTAQSSKYRPPGARAGGGGRGTRPGAGKNAREKEKRGKRKQVPATRDWKLPGRVAMTTAAATHCLPLPSRYSALLEKQPENAHVFAEPSWACGLEAALRSNVERKKIYTRAAAAPRQRPMARRMTLALYFPHYRILDVSDVRPGGKRWRLVRNVTEVEPPRPASAVKRRVAKFSDQLWVADRPLLRIVAYLHSLSVAERAQRARANTRSGTRRRLGRARPVGSEPAVACVVQINTKNIKMAITYAFEKVSS